MESTAIEAVTLGGSVDPYTWSMWDLFARADITVKIIIIMLLAASFWCWAIIFDKGIGIRRVKHKTAMFEESFWSGGSLDDLYDRVGTRPGDPMSAVFSAAMTEWRRSAARGLKRDSAAVASLRERMERVMQVTLSREMDRLERYLAFLASVGSTAPFVGLFGTVWGIMNSFQSIAVTKNTSLAVVAPGIAEALFATALGLAAAIPAVVAYNKLSNDLGRYAGRLQAFVDEFGAMLWRQLDERP